LFARAVHHLSPRRAGPFVALNCAAIPETLIENELFGHEKGAFTGAGDRRLGKFELANGGTVFLDEIGEMPLSVQGKLLRVLEERAVDRIGGRHPIPVNVRIVAATNRDLRAASETGEFRRDLFFRLAVFPVEIPPLRERAGDTVLLAQHFARTFGKELRGRPAELSAEALEVIRRYHWPGNVRELENVIERACILADGNMLQAHDLGLLFRHEPENLAELNLDGSLAEATERAVAFTEKRKIRAALRACDGNKTRAAELLEISYKTLLNKLKDYDL
jgi:transcriptional regulator with PAS, ATPase and Fis domain